MRFISDILENLGIMVLTIVALIGGGWLVLWLLQLGLKLKSGTREEEGLVDLWQQVMVKPAPEKKGDDQKNKDSINKPGS
ncbi:MAG: hypothetical protein M0036_22955 [Desulfobacteraceae bacterium]|nr:hypothetical protein [Desulfobacteraceae bacterium]